MLTFPTSGTSVAVPVPPVSDRFRVILLYQVTARMRLTARRQNRLDAVNALTERMAFLNGQIGRA